MKFKITGKIIARTEIEVEAETMEDAFDKVYSLDLKDLASAGKILEYTFEDEEGELLEEPRIVEVILTKNKGIKIVGLEKK